MTYNPSNLYTLDNGRFRGYETEDPWGEITRPGYFSGVEPGTLVHVLTPRVVGLLSILDSKRSVVLGAVGR